MQFQQVGSLSFVWTEGPRVKWKIKKEINKETKNKERKMREKRNNLWFQKIKVRVDEPL